MILKITLAFCIIVATTKLFSANLSENDAIKGLFVLVITVIGIFALTFLINDNLMLASLIMIFMLMFCAIHNNNLF